MTNNVDIDAEPTTAERIAAETLIAAELGSDTTTTAAILPPLREPQFSDIITQELARIESQAPLRAIDTTRYEDSSTSTSTSSSSPSEQQQEKLSRAYAISTYLTSRETHLRLLDAHGRNAWLVGNLGSEAEVAAVERELAEARRDVDRVNLQRRRAQDEAAGELRSLEEAWKRGVGRVLEAEAAAEGVRREVLERQRARAQQAVVGN